jgi:hypothetical protein
MKISYEIHTALQYRCQHAEKRVEELESGEAFQKSEKAKAILRKYYDRKVRKLSSTVSRLERQLVQNREMWLEVFLDVQDEYEKRLDSLRKEIGRLERELAAERNKGEELRKKLKQKTREVTEERERTNDEKEKNQKLTSQINQNFGNSSIPSSQDRFRGKVANNREKTGRPEGGQPGHEGHRRKKHVATEEPVYIPAPPEITGNPEYYRQSGPNSIVRKQVVGIRFQVYVKEYYADVYRNRRTGARYHAPFPPGAQLEVNYDDSIKALVFLLKNHLNVSEEKIGEFILEITDGEVSVSRGMINGINSEFSGKTEGERKDIFASLSSSPVMYTDMTGARMNGKLKNVVVCSNKKDVFYAFRDAKGDMGFKGTPVEYFLNVLVHDHDKTSYHYGGAHQECNAHHTRYLKGAEENEPELQWHGKMRQLLLEMNTCREKKEGRMLSEEEIRDFSDRYDEILDLADKEYEDNPPSKYYRKGYNLSLELREYKDAVLLFLGHPDVDFTNNEAERTARKVKRHLAVSGTFRGKSNIGGESYCEAMTVLQTDRNRGEPVWEKVRGYFRREGKKKGGGRKKHKGNEADTISS